MRIEVPVFKRCCFCLPLRYGLLVWGYLRLFFSILLLSGFVFTWHTFYNMSEKNRQSFTTGDRVSLTISTVVMIFDIPIILLFIVGCHMKNMKIMKIFYFYSQFILGLTMAVVIYRSISIAVSLINHNFLMFEVVDVFGCIAHTILQLYMFLLLRSEIIKLSNSFEFRFVNLGAEAQCNLSNNNSSKVNETVIGISNEV